MTLLNTYKTKSDNMCKHLSDWKYPGKQIQCAECGKILTDKEIDIVFETLMQ